MRKGLGYFAKGNVVDVWNQRSSFLEGGGMCLTSRRSNYVDGIGVARDKMIQARVWQSRQLTSPCFTLGGLKASEKVRNSPRRWMNFLMGQRAAQNK